MRLWELNGDTFEKIRKDIAILPVGSLERHGNHLPLGTDTIIPLRLAKEVSKRLRILLMPPIWYGSCRGLREFPGTFDVDSMVFHAYVLNVMLEAARNGVKLLIVLNGHGGNTSALLSAAREAAHKSDMSVVVLNWWTDIGVEARKALFKHPGHAGEDETSLLLAIRPDLVNMSKAFDHLKEYPSFRIYSRKIEKEVYKQALNGSATLATSEKGKLWLNALVEDLIKVIKESSKLLGIDVEDNNAI